MCGIFFYKYLSGQKVDVDRMTTYFNRIKHRGPDKSVSKILGDDTFIGFHRLAINGLTEMGDQPFIYEKESGAHVYVICNGEIYNYKDLNEKYELELEEGESDCAVIYPLFEKQRRVASVSKYLWCHSLKKEEISRSEKAKKSFGDLRLS